jgi:hypothetical protein
MPSKQGSDELNQVIADTCFGPIDAISNRNKSVPSKSVRVPTSRKQNRQTDRSDAQDQKRSSKELVPNPSCGAFFRNFDSMMNDREYLYKMRDHLTKRRALAKAKADINGRNEDVCRYVRLDGKVCILNILLRDETRKARNRTWFGL